MRTHTSDERGPFADDDEWIPLPDPRPRRQNEGATDANDPRTDRETNRRFAESRERSSSSSSSSSRRASNHDDDLRRLRNRLEDRATLREGLLNRPTKSFGRVFCGHLLREMWREPLSVRLGAALLLVGALLETARCVVCATRSLPAASLVTLVGAALVRRDLRGATTVPDDATDHAAYARHVRLALLLSRVLPAWAEVRSYLFLVDTVVATPPDHREIAFAVVAVVAQCVAARRATSPADARRRARTVLTSCAFVVAVLGRRSGHRAMLWWGGPLCLALGSASLSYDDDDDDDAEWWSRILRRCLRSTSRDVLTDLRENVSEDEMLQLAMLRWIADYWGLSKTKEPTKDKRSDDASRAANASSRGRDASSERRKTGSTAAADKASSTAPASSVRNADSLAWEDLFPMLSTTTRRMESEMRASSSSSSSSSDRAPSSRRGAAGAPTPFDGLRDLLNSIDVDDRAVPAVRAFRNAVFSFPPSKSACEIVSVAGKLPAMLAVLWLTRYAGRSDDDGDAWRALVLIPSVVLEILRVLDWSESVARLREHYSREGADDRDPEESSASYRVALLSTARDANDDPYRAAVLDQRAPTLLRVWRNLARSVRTLERAAERAVVGVKCAKTTVVAKDLCDNVVSLASLGARVYARGLAGGAGLLVTELSSSTTDRSYADDLAGAIANGGLVMRRLTELAEEHNVSLRPACETVLGAVGRRLPWGAPRRDDDDESGATTTSPENNDRTEQTDNENEFVSVDDDDDEPRAEVVEHDEPHVEVVKDDEPRAEAVEHDEPRAEVVEHDEPRAEVVEHDEPRAEVAEHDEPRAEVAEHDEPRAEVVEHDEPRAEVVEDECEDPSSSAIEEDEPSAEDAESTEHGEDARNLPDAPSQQLENHFQQPPEAPSQRRENHFQRPRAATELVGAKRESSADNDDEELPLPVLLQRAISETVALNAALRSSDEVGNDCSKVKSPESDEESLPLAGEKETLLASNNGDEKMTELFDMVSSALEQRLITVEEKNNIVQQIVSCTGTADASRHELLSALSKSLESVLGTDDDFAPIQNEVVEGNARLDETSVQDDYFVKTETTPIAHHHHVEEEPPSDAASSSDRKGIRESPEPRPMTKEQSWVDLTHRNVSEDDEGWESIPNATVREAKKEVFPEGGTVVVDDDDDERERKHDNLAHVIGGGLTVLGAVVGGIMLMSGDSDTKEATGTSDQESNDETVSKQDQHSTDGSKKSR